MKKATLLTLTLLVCTLICGCQMGPSDEELINTTMNNWKQAVLAKGLNAFISSWK